MRSIDLLSPQHENDNSTALSENDNLTAKAIENMTATMKEVVESSTSNNEKTVTAFREAFEKTFITSKDDNENKNDEPEEAEREE